DTSVSKCELKRRLAPPPVPCSAATTFARSGKMGCKRTGIPFCSNQPSTTSASGCSCPAGLNVFANRSASAASSSALMCLANSISDIWKLFPSSQRRGGDSRLRFAERRYSSFLIPPQRPRKRSPQEYLDQMPFVFRRALLVVDHVGRLS